MLLLFGYITHSLLVTVDEIMLIALVDWTFLVLYFLKLFIISCKYDLTS